MYIGDEQTKHIVRQTSVIIKKHFLENKAQ